MSIFRLAKKEIPFSDLLGKTLTAIVGAAKGEDEIFFTDSEGNRYVMFHQQDCCEDVRVEDVVGDIEDLIGSPIVRAEDRSNDDPDADESATFTFYELATNKGSVTIRWYGQSNGYYSEDVTFGLVSEKS